MATYKGDYKGENSRGHTLSEQSEGSYEIPVFFPQIKGFLKMTISHTSQTRGDPIPNIFEMQVYSTKGSSSKEEQLTTLSQHWEQEVQRTEVPE